MEFHFVDVESEGASQPQPTSPCPQCGETALNEDMWIVKTGSGRTAMCDSCFIETNPTHAKTYYYDSPYCEKCGCKIRGNHVCGDSFGM